MLIIILLGGIMKILFFFLMFSVVFLFFFEPSSASQQDEILITILYDNTAAQEGVEADWGFSCLIEGTEKTILFDTGTKSDLFFRNVEALKADLNRVEIVVISHDHGDHTGSLVPFLKKKSDVSVYLLTSFRDVLFQEVKETGAKIVSVQDPVEICKNVHTTGCAHPGIVGIVKKAKQMLNKDINLVFGGFHLMETPAAQIREIIADFRELGVKKVGATHCTGNAAIQMFREEWGKNFVELGVGRKISILK
jgi:7,8-dihydropterin-6-yl-methyl-4-(beta-D-ribofuranosyl)aminobenzene 5'-phosphate synthase